MGIVHSTTFITSFQSLSSSPPLSPHHVLHSCLPDLFAFLEETRHTSKCPLWASVLLFLLRGVLAPDISVAPAIPFTQGLAPVFLPMDNSSTLTLPTPFACDIFLCSVATPTRLESSCVHGCFPCTPNSP